MPLFAIDTVLQFRHTYVVEAENLVDAQDAVVMRDSGNDEHHFDEVTQRYLGETIVSGRKISKDEFEHMLVDLSNNTDEVSSHWMREKLIHRVQY